MNPEPKYVIRSRYRHSAVKRLDVSNSHLFVRVTFVDGSVYHLSFDQANKSITVNGIPVIDWYARLN